MSRPSRPSVKFDEYIKIDWVAEAARLDKVAKSLSGTIGSTVYIIHYNGRKHNVGESEAAVTKAYEYLKNTK